MIPDIRLCDLSTARQDFVRQCQRISFGKIAHFAVRNGDPVMLPETEVLMELKLETEEAARPEQKLKDFVVPAELVRLFAKMDAVRTGFVDHVEVRAGIPRRVVFKTRVQG